MRLSLFLMPKRPQGHIKLVFI
uniref:Uncharacterized protein n=1 Tax=Rhizophora mucronata TaxID=61149 RepID=A0A2P2PRI7_RHIMU